MERARRNLQLTEKQLGQVQKKRAQAAEQLQRAVCQGADPAQLSPLEKNVRDLERAIKDLEARMAMLRTSIFKLKLDRAAWKARRKLAQQDSVGSDAVSDLGDLIPAVRAPTATSPASQPTGQKVALSPAAEPLSIGSMLFDAAVTAGVVAGVGFVLITGAGGCLIKKLRLW